MFFVNQNGSNLSIKPYHSFSMGHVTEIQILENVKQLNIVGKSSIFDTFYNHFTNCQTITFNGSKYFDFPESLQVELYSMGELGYLFHDKKARLAYASRSLSLLNDYCTAFSKSLIGLMKDVNRNIQVEPFYLNDDFTRKQLNPNEVDIEENSIFEFDWNNNSYNHFVFGMVIEAKTYVEKKGMFYTKYSGRALNIGHFEQYIVVDDPDKNFPEFFPERELNYNIIFTDLDNDNAQDVLIPNIMLPEEYKQMIQQAKTNGRSNIVLSGLSRFGYGIQAFITILPEEQSTALYEAIVTKLVVSPMPNLEASFIFR